MSAPTDPPANHYLYFDTIAAARAAEQDITRLGMETEIRPGASGNNWLVLVSHSWPITEDEFDEIERKLTDIAEAHKGEYDGWEVPVIQEKRERQYTQPWLGPH